MPEEISIETVPDVVIDVADGLVQSEHRTPLEDSSVECDRIEDTPTKLANQIAKFHAWLAVAERVSYSKTEPKSPGWCLEHLQELRERNIGQKANLESKQTEISRLVSSSEKQLKTEGGEIDNDKLLWAYLMLEQRYNNLLLFYVDTEFMLDRRIDVLAKNCKTTDVVAHPLDEVWTDRGTPVEMCSDDESGDYDVLV